MNSNVHGNNNVVFFFELPNTQYAFAPVIGGTRIAFYDIGQVFISRTTDGVSSFTTPSKAKFTKLSTINSGLNTLQDELGTTPTTYQEYGYSWIMLL